MDILNHFEAKTDTPRGKSLHETTKFLSNGLSRPLIGPDLVGAIHDDSSGGSDVNSNHHCTLQFEYWIISSPGNGNRGIFNRERGASKSAWTRKNSSQTSPNPARPVANSNSYAPNPCGEGPASKGDKMRDRSGPIVAQVLAKGVA